MYISTLWWTALYSSKAIALILVKTVLSRLMGPEQNMAKPGCKQKSFFPTTVGVALNHAVFVLSELYELYQDWLFT